MPSPVNTRHLDPEVALLVQELKESGGRVEEADEARQIARIARRQVAEAAFASGISWRTIAELGRYGSAQAAQQDVTNNTSPGRRSGD